MVHDGHTSKMPFFHGLDNETAFHYSTFSPRQSFCNMYRDTPMITKLIHSSEEAVVLAFMN